MPVAAIPSLEGVVSLRFARQSLSVTNTGQVTSQGDHVMRADAARDLFGLDGSGVKVGALSDSFDCQGGAASDVANGDLSPVDVVEEEVGCSSGSDEGRAMLQIVHDVAPNASLAFASATNGMASFASNIRALRDVGAKVIVDDVIYPLEPMFQDGVIAQAVDEVVGDGVTYFSSAGNFRRLGYDHAFVLATSPFGIPAHNFGGTTLQKMTLPFGVYTIVLQWDSPFFSVSGPPGAQNDLDLFILQSDGAGGFSIVTASTNDNIASGEPVEWVVFECPFSQCVGHILISHFAGPVPGRLKYVVYPGNSFSPPTFSPAISSGTIYGHANANGAIAVGAANYKTPTTLESFSSGGTTPVLLDTDGNLLPSPDPRQFKPWIVAPDGGNTTFFGFDDSDADGFPNFLGTSASAPHAAAVAALMLHANPSLTPADVREILRDTAQNMGPAGFDTNTGYGLIRADSALNGLHEFEITTAATGTPKSVIPSGTVSLGVVASDSFGHTLTYAWTSTCATELAPGTFDDASLAAATWTAPLNATGSSKTCALKVTVTDGHGFSRTSTHTATVQSVPRVLSVPAPAAVGTTVVITGSSLTGASAVTFSGPVTVTPVPVTATSATVIVPPGARTGVLSVTTPAGVGASSGIFKVLPKITGFTPPSPVGGSAQVVTVTGTNLRAVTGVPVVKIGSLTVPAAAITASTPTELQFTVPLGAVNAKISVTTVDGTALSVANLGVQQPPRATGFSPNPAPIGTTLTITGTNLTGVTEVTFSGTAVLSCRSPGALPRP